MGDKLHIVFAGNPGVGKSTILNSLTGESDPIFKSGISLGSGLTTVLQKHETQNYILGDTPGLADVKTKEQAAKEIVNLFRSVKFMKLIFVVTLEAGRIKPEDVATMDLILSSFQNVDMTNRFGVIINKVSPQVKAMIEDEGNFLATFAALNVKFKTCHIAVNDFEMSLFDQENIVSQPTNAVKTLVTTVNTITVDGVSDIDVDAIGRVKAEYEERIAEIYQTIKKDKKKSKRELERQAAKLEELSKERDELLRRSAEMFNSDPFKAIGLALEALGAHFNKKFTEVVNMFSK